jgi:hypothetical protein
MVARKLWRRRSLHFGDHGFRRNEKAADRGRTLKGRAHDLGGVDNSPRDQIAGTRKSAHRSQSHCRWFQNLGDDDRAVGSGMGGNLPCRPGDLAKCGV